MRRRRQPPATPDLPRKPSVPRWPVSAPVSAVLGRVELGHDDVARGLTRPMPRLAPGVRTLVAAAALG